MSEIEIFPIHKKSPFSWTCHYTITTFLDLRIELPSPSPPPFSGIANIGPVPLYSRNEPSLNESLRRGGRYNRPQCIDQQCAGSNGSVKVKLKNFMFIWG